MLHILFNILRHQAICPLEKKKKEKKRKKIRSISSDLRRCVCSFVARLWGDRSAAPVFTVLYHSLLPALSYAGPISLALLFAWPGSLCLGESVTIFFTTKSYFCSSLLQVPLQVLMVVTCVLNSTRHSYCVFGEEIFALQHS